MQKDVLGIWVKVPCEHNVGSCTYGICSNSTITHPRLFNHELFSKKCPTIPPAIYSVSNLVYGVSKSIPSIADGSFRITVDFSSNFVCHVACLHLDLNLNAQLDNLS